MGLKSIKCSKGIYYFQQEEPTRNAPSVTSSFENVLEDVGSHGKFQKLLIWAFMLPLAVFNSLGSANTALLLSTPNHSCHVPGRPNNITEEAWKNMTVPWISDNLGNTKQSSCKMVKNTSGLLDWLNDFENPIDVSLNYSKNIANSRPITECQYGWDFDDSVWKETPVTKFGWVCNNKGIVTMLFSLTYAGNAVGTLLFSIISDRFGRKPTFYFVLCLSVFCSIATLFAPSLAVYGTFKFLLALAYYSFYQMPYIIVVEVCSERLRTFTAVSSFIACNIGTALVSLFAYLSKHWKIFILVCHLPSFLFVFSFRSLPESPRWLLSRSRVAECETILKRIAYINGRSYTDHTRRLLLEAQKEEAREGSLKNIFNSLVLAKHLVLTSILLSVGYILYSGMILNIHNMSGNKILNFFLLLVVEIPGNIIGSLSAKYFGRRLSTVVFNTTASLCCISSVLAVSNEWLLLVLCALTKMSAGSLVLVVYMQIGELFPASLRGSAYGITGIIGIAAMTLIPPLIATGGSNLMLPYYILSGIGLLGVILSSFLPETVGHPLPQTIDEAVCIGQNQPFFSLIHKWNVHDYLEVPRHSETYTRKTSGREDVVYQWRKCDD